MNKTFLQFFQDGSGSYSATRLAFLLWSFFVLTVWCYVSIKTEKLVTIDQQVVTIIGILMTGKVVQSFSVSDGTPKPP